MRRDAIVSALIGADGSAGHYRRRTPHDTRTCASPFRFQPSSSSTGCCTASSSACVQLCSPRTPTPSENAIHEFRNCSHHPTRQPLVRAYPASFSASARQTSCASQLPSTSLPARLSSATMHCLTRATSGQRVGSRGGSAAG